MPHPLTRTVHVVLLLLALCGSICTASTALSDGHLLEVFPGRNGTEGVTDSYLVYTGYTDVFRNVFIPSRKYLRFHVRACSDVIVALSAVPGVTNRQTYEVLIGGAQNNRSEIRVYDRGQPAFQNSTPSILDCDEYRPFWIKWEDNNLQVGRGHDVGKDIFMQVKNPPNSHEVRGVSVRTRKNTPGKWIIRRGIFAYIHTPDVYKNKYMWTPVRLGQQSAIIRVKACSDVHVALAPILDNATQYVEVIIGGWKNEQTAIRTKEGDSEKIQAAEDTPGVVNCHEWRQFWIRWEYNVVEAGIGNDVGASRLIHWSSVDPVEVAALSVSTGNGYTGEWGFSEFSSKSVLVSTHHNDASLARIRPDRDAFVFRVVACSDAELNLLRRPGDLQSVAYRVILGANENTMTRIFRVDDHGRNQTLLKEAHTPYILDCDNPRDFWVFYGYGIFIVGKEQQVFENLILDISDVEMVPVHEIAMSGHGAAWIFERDYALSVSLITTGNFGIGRLWLSVAYAHHVVFKVRACANVHVALAKYMGMEDYDSYEVVIGADFNSATQIRNVSNGRVIAESTTENVLHCNITRYFWIDWEGGTIHVGQGRTVGSRLLVTAKIRGWKGVSGMSICTAGGEPGMWEFTQQNEQELVLSQYGWLATHRSSLSFKAKSCYKDVTLTLTKTPFSVDDTEVKVVIGAAANQQTQIIHVSRDGTTTKHTMNTPNILDCFSMRPFWISWERGVLKFGKGETLEDAFVSPQPVDEITGVFFWSYSTEAAYSYSRDEGSLTRMTTAHNTQKNPLWVSVDDITYATFKVKGCSDAAVILAESYGVTIDFAYKISLGEKSNTNSSICRLPSSDPVVSAFTPDILSCHNFTYFWVRWTDGVIEVGQSRRLGANRLLHWSDPHPRAIHFVTMSAGLTDNVVWEFITFKGETYTVLTPDYLAYESFRMTPRQELFTFSVSACHSASVALSLSGYHNHSFDLELIIGDDRNRKSVIRDMRDRGQVVVEAPTPGILHCYKVMDFWIDWHEGLLRVGEGMPDHRQFLEWQISQYSPVSSLALSTAQRATGEWTVGFEQAKSVTVATPDKRTFKTTWMAVTDRNYVVFAVRTCEEAIISVSDIPGITNYHTYLVLIGHDKNTASSIRDARKDTVLNTLSTPGILNCDEAQTFWIGWGLGFLAVGSGGRVGSGGFLEYYDPDVYPVNSLAFSTGATSQGEWEFHAVKGNMYSFRTPGIDRFNDIWIIPSRNYILFEVMTCSDVQIALSATPGGSVQDAHEVVIGGSDNTRIGIRSKVSGSMVKDVTMNNLLHCNESRPFWITWSVDSVKVGRGESIGEPLIAWDSRDVHPILGLTLTTGLGKPAHWHFPQEGTAAVRANIRQQTGSDALWVDSRDRTSMVFKVRSCGGATVALSDIVEMTTRLTYIVVLGASQNTKSAIHPTPHASHAIEVDTPDILDCDADRTFWISWETGKLQVGYGSVVHSYVFLAWTDPGPHPVSSVGFLRNVKGDTVWTLNELDGKTYTVHSPELYGYRTVWLNVTQPYFVFHVRACRDAHVIMSSRYGHADINSYEVVIGAGDNQQTIIREDQLGWTVSRKDTPEVLSCEQIRTFWVSFDGGRVRVGSGAKAYTQQMVHWDDPSPIDVTAVSVSTGWGATGEWAFAASQGTLLMATSPVHEYASWISMLGNTSLQFRVKACESVYIALSELKGHTQSLTYEIALGLNNNSLSEIRDGVNGNAKAKIVHPVLDCSEMKPFWIMWTRGVILVGRGDTVGQNKFLIWQPQNPHDISAVSMTSGGKGVGAWEFYTPVDTTLPTVTPPTTPTTQRTTATTSPSPITPHRTSEHTLPSTTTHVVPPGPTPPFPGTPPLTTFPGIPQPGVPTSQPGQPSADSRMSAGIVIAIAFGVVTAVLIIATILLFVFGRRHSERQRSDTGGNALHFDNPMYSETALYGSETVESDVGNITGKLTVFPE